MIQPRNILYILPVAERGGAERIVEAWAARHSSEFRPHVLVPAAGPLTESLKGLGVKVVVPPHFRMRHFVSTIQFLIKYIRSESIDLIHSTMPRGHLFGGMAAALSRCKEIWFHHGPLAPKRYQGMIPLIPSESVLVANEYMRHMQAPTYFNARNIRVVGLGIDTNLISPDNAAREELRTKYNISPETMVIGMFGRLISWKGQDVLIRALHLLKLRRPRCRFHCFLVGGTLFGREPEFQNQLKTMIQTRGLTDRVTLTGNVDNVYPYYDLTDVVVHASIVPEPFGLVVSEGMAKQKIVVATTGGGPSEMITHGVNGFLYEPGDEQQLSEILIDLADTFEKNGAADMYLREVSSRARSSIVQTHSIEQSVSNLESVYRDILQ